jgi:hypothetical protein
MNQLTPEQFVALEMLKLLTAYSKLDLSNCEAIKQSFLLAQEFLSYETQADSEK